MPTAPVAVVARSSYEHTVDRHGLVVLAGIVANDASTIPRVDVILPVPLADAPQLRFGLSLGYDHISASAPDGTAADSYSGAIYPTAYYDWRLPIVTSAGDFVGSVEGGFGLAIARLKIDEPFMPGTYKTLTAVAFRAAGSIQFRAHNGFVVSVQPLGIEVPVTTPDSPDPKFMVKASTQWEGALLCGYQFQ